MKMKKDGKTFSKESEKAMKMKPEKKKKRKFEKTTPVTTDRKKPKKPVPVIESRESDKERNKTEGKNENVVERKKRKRNAKKKNKVFNKRNKYLHLVLQKAGLSKVPVNTNVNKQQEINDALVECETETKAKKKSKKANPSVALFNGKHGRSDDDNIEQSSKVSSKKKTKKRKRDNEDCEIVKKKKLKSSVDSPTTNGCSVDITNDEKKEKSKKRKSKIAIVTAEENAPKAKKMKFKNVNGQIETKHSKQHVHVLHEDELNVDVSKSKAVPPIKKKKVDMNDPANIRERSRSLKDRVKEKLAASQFRYFNEQLYTTTGKSAFRFFSVAPAKFEIYHRGYKSQVAKWPVNPLQIIIDSIQNSSSSLVIADMGCGDATLAASVSNVVHSFDLVALNDRVTVCDIAKVPLKKESVDIVVFCLSLMGTNLVDYLLEASRILKVGGLLKIAEIESRFEKVRIFTKALGQLGFKLMNEDSSNKMFVLLDFKKDKRCKSSKPPSVELKPCLYKKR